MLLDFFGTITITMTMFVTVYALVSTLPVAPARRLVLAVVVGAWIGLSVAFAASGQYVDATTRAFPLIGVIFAIPLIATAALAIYSPSVRATLLALPMPLLIGLNATRVFGGFFLLLAADSRLGGPFPYSAGWGDVIAGVFALPVAMLAARAGTSRDWIAGAWNAFGMLDLAVAVALGVTSAVGSPLQIFDSGAGSSAIQYLPWALIPTVLVPYFLIVHAVIFAQLRARARGQGRFAGQAKGELA